MREAPDSLGAQGHYAVTLVTCGGPRAEAQKIAAAFAQGQAWSGTTMHLEGAFSTLRDYPPFVELMTPKG